jgi:beta-glucosidase
MEAGYAAQLASITMLKNADSVLPIKEKQTVYVPQIHVPATINFFGFPTEAYDHYPVELDILRKDYNITDNPEEADFAIAFVKSPTSVGYDHKDRENGGNGYLPISLQHADYVAENARAQSIAAGDPVVDPSITNRSYKGKTALSNQRFDLPMLQDLREKMGDKPIVLVVSTSNPMVFAQVEPLVDAILLDFGVQTSAMMDVITGRHEPSGLLPLQMPASMEEVELQKEDVPMDMMPYIDSEDHSYDFAFGMNWSGVICDKRTQRYFGMEQDW